MEADTIYPYSVLEWEKDVRRWCAATKVSAERQGPLLSLAVGSAARIYADEITVPILQHGGYLDLADGQGQVWHSGVDILLAVLKQKFPPDAEAQMLRTGLDFFTFTPSRSENMASMFLRFDFLLDKANQQTNLGIAYPFRAWMLLSLLRLPSKRWAEVLKECNRRLPQNAAEYQEVKAKLLRDEAIEKNVHTFHGKSHHDGGGHAGLLFAEEQEPIPLYLALANGGAPSSGVTTTTTTTTRALPRRRLMCTST